MKYDNHCKQALLEAQETAKSFKSAHVEPEHLFWLELIRDYAHLSDFLEGNGVSRAHFQGRLKERIDQLPHSQGFDVRQASNRLKNVFSRVHESEDGLVTWQELLRAILEITDDPLSDLLWDFSLTPADFGKYDEREKALAEGGIIQIPSEGEVLSKYCIDLTQLAEEGRIGDVIGRSNEIRQIATILSQKMTNNPILVGDPGVGKTQIVEGLAKRIARNEAGEILSGKKIYTLDVGLLLAGAQYRGEFEERLKAIISAIKAQQGRIILFVDEIHTLMGAGQTSGALDAANLIKPALARGELWMIGATTYVEFRHHIEKDPAFTRRFVRINVAESSEDETFEILRGIRPKFQEHHKATIEDAQLRTVVTLTGRFIRDNQFPAKAIQMMDNALARVKLVAMTGERTDAIVTDADIAEAVSDKTGVPGWKILQNEAERLLTLGTQLRETVIGQDAVIRRLVDRYKLMGMPFRGSGKPRGVFFFYGPSGVGKSLMAREISRIMYDSEKSMIALDMSEYGDEHSVRRLTGADPGLVGYEEGGFLTEAVRRRPYSLLVLEDVDKAHRKVLGMFARIFEEGTLTDNKGNAVSFSDTVVLLTANPGFDSVAPRQTPDESAARALLLQRLGTDVVKKIDEVFLFRALDEEDAKQIIRRKLESFAAAFAPLAPSGACTLSISDETVDAIVRTAYQPAYGARSLHSWLDSVAATAIADAVLRRRVEAGDDFVPGAIALDLDGAALRVELPESSSGAAVTEDGADPVPL